MKSTKNILHVGEYYRNMLTKLHAGQFRNQCEVEMEISRATFYTWMRGSATPSKLEREKLVQVLNNYLSHTITIEEVQFGEPKPATV